MEALRMHVTPHIPKMALVRGEWSVSWQISENMTMKIKLSRSNSGNACYRLPQDLLSSLFLFKDTKIKIYKTIILPVVLYGCKIWSLN
jgi:hypothetical protein